MRGIYLQLKLNLHLYVFKLRDNKNGLLTSHSGYSSTIVSLEIFFLFFLTTRSLGTPLSKKDRGFFFSAVYRRPQRPYWPPLGGLHCPVLAPRLPPRAPPRGGPPWCPDPRRPAINYEKVHTVCLVHLDSLCMHLSIVYMDQITIKTPNPKCRLYWCLIEFIDWRYSQSYWYFRPRLWTSAPLTF